MLAPCRKPGANLPPLHGTHVGRLLRLAPAVGAGLVSASAIGAVIGAIYLQALFDGVHAGWATGLLPASTILRTGLLGASAAALALAGLLPNTIIQTTTLRVMILVLAAHAVGAAACAALRFWGPPVFVAHWSRYLETGVIVFWHIQSVSLSPSSSRFESTAASYAGESLASVSSLAFLPAW